MSVPLKFRSMLSKLNLLMGADNKKYFHLHGHNINALSSTECVNLEASKD